MYKRKIILVLGVALVLSGCTSEDDNQRFNSGRTNVKSIQQDFRDSILAQYIEPEKKELVIAEPINSAVVQSDIGAESAELKAWRAGIQKSWSEIPQDKFYVVCELFFRGILDPESTFGPLFKQTRDELAREGTEIYSLTDIKLLADNRKTIQFPTINFSSSLFVCSGRIVLKPSNGILSQPLTATIAWNYYLENGSIKYTITFKTVS